MKARRGKSGSAARAVGAAGMRARLERTEERLREVEERHRLAMAAIRESVYDYDVLRDSIYYSDSMQRELALPPGTLRTPQDWRDRIHPDDVPRYREAFVAHLKGTTERFVCDYRYRGVDGTWRWARQHGLAVRDKNGRALRVVGSTGDITDLKRAEESLEHVRGRYDLALRAIHEGVYEWDIASGTAYYSERLYEVLTLTPGDLNSPMDWRKRIHPEDLPSYDAGLVAHFKGQTERFECEYRYKARDGSWRWARQHGLAVRDAGGRALRMIGSTGDITDLKQAQEALRTSEDRYARATEAAVEGIYEWDIVAGRLFLTERAKEFFSFSSEELTPAAWNVRVHAEDYPRYRAAIVEHFKGRNPQLEIEYRITDPSGGYRWVLDRGKAVRNGQGRAVKMVGALSDITERKRAEIELRRARDEATESLEQQTATAEILKVMSGSLTDIQPVVDVVAATAARLCEADDVLIQMRDGDVMRSAAHHGSIPATPTRPVSPKLLLGRVVREGRQIQVEDIQKEDDQYPESAESARRLGFHTILHTPLMRAGKVIGIITMRRTEVKPFNEKQKALVKTFADQAVIAIENVRLFNETKDALERQTATSEVLKVISQTRIDLEPVLDIVLKNARRLCGADQALIFRADEEGNCVPAALQVTERANELMEFYREHPIRPNRGSATGRAVLERRAIHIPDVLADPEYRLEYAANRNYRSILAVPMLREGSPIGVLTVTRVGEPRPFTDKQIELVTSFADQAVIAVENVRLFNETTEALEQQKASAEILRVISGSIADTKPVFDAILESCERLFEGKLVGINLIGDDGFIRNVAYHGPGFDELEKVFPLPVDRHSGSGSAIVERHVMHYPDLENGADVPEGARRGGKATGIKAEIFAPMMWEGRGQGVIFVGREYAGPFSEKEVALLKTFADQAVIAIQNARLFREINEKSRQVEIANHHKSEFLANMSHELRTPLNAIIGFTRIVMRRAKEQLEPKQYENLEKIHSSGQHLLQLINAILDLSKVEAGRVEVNAADVALGSVLEQCVKTVEPLVKAPTVRLLKEFDGELPQVYLDEEKLRQIVINLLSNAVKFTERGTVRLRAKCNGDGFAVAVADTGIGIPAEKLEHVFEEFAQADASSTRVYGGTGLGLTIARRLARLMGGDISAQSEQGVGSTFTLTLPVRYQALAEVQTQPPAQARA